MSSFRLLFIAGLALAPFAWAAPELGKPIDAKDLATWDISIPPTGEGLPTGSGTASQGTIVYGQKCLACHGEDAAGKPADALVGGVGTLRSKNPVRTVGSFWPYATTLFDYIRRAMPYNKSKSLSSDELYAVCAYILAKNGIIAEDFVLDAKTLPQVKMPNRDGFIDASKSKQ
ncbi:MAG: cytochrome c [Burkholderiales bacterium]